MPPLPIDRLLDLGYLFDPNPGPPSDWYAILAAVFGLILIVLEGGYYFWARSAFARDPYRLKLARKVAIAGSVVSLVAILFIIARMLTIPVLSMRVLLLLAVLAGIGLLLYFAYYMTRVYPMRLALNERESVRQRYLPQQRPKQMPASVRKRKKGKKKR